MSIDTTLLRLVRLEGIQARRYALFYRKATTLRGRARETFLQSWPA